MRASARANQGGSIVSFIIVGTLLLAGLGAGVYYISRDDSQVDQDPVAVNEPEESEREGRSPIAEGGDIADPDEEQNQGDSQPNEDEPADSDEPATDPEREDEVPAADTEEGQTEEDRDDSAPEQIASTGGSGVDSLPQSGPAEVALSLAALFVVTFIVFTFRRSRRDLAREINGQN